MSDLELRVAQGLMQLRALETALHSPYGWEIEVDGERAPAVPWRHSRGIEFVAEFEFVSAESSVTLLHYGEAVLCRPFEGPDYSGELAWDLVVEEEQLA